MIDVAGVAEMVKRWYWLCHKGESKGRGLAAVVIRMIKLLVVG